MPFYLSHKFIFRLYKTVFPEGLPQTLGHESVPTLHVKSSSSPSLHTSLAHKPSKNSLVSISSSSSASNIASNPAPAQLHPGNAGGFFSRLIGSTSSSLLPLPTQSSDGPVENFIVAGTAFGQLFFTTVRDYH